MKPEELNERLIRFAVGIVQLAQSIPRSVAGNHLASQLIRSGTSPALHYGEAQSGESLADFIHKMRIAAKELRESYNNIKIILNLNWCKKEEIDPLLNEAHQLVSIFTASIKTAQNKSKINNHQS